MANIITNLFTRRQRYLTLSDVKRQHPHVRHLFQHGHNILSRLNSLNGGLICFLSAQPKRTNQFITYPHTERMISRETENDRVFPLDNVAIQEFQRKHDTEIEEATIHTGPYANELARTFNVLALAIGSDIFFRHNAYKPETEEGRKTIAHELTHVSQYQKGELAQNTTREILETAAERAEAREQFDKDSVVSIKLRRNRYLIPRSKMKSLAQKASRMLNDWLASQKTILDGKEYLTLLCAVEKWIGR